MERPISLSTAPLSPFPDQGIMSLTSKRQKIVREIYDSEQTYISQLNTIVELFLKPIRVGGYLSQSNILTIFSNIEGLLAVNSELLNFMRQSSLGDAFLYLGPFLKLYGSYSGNFQTATATLEKCLKSDQRFNDFILTQESRPECNYLNLSALLIVPVQRIPRYKLLLDDLLKHTKQTHIEYTKINSAVQQISAVASYINEYIRFHQNQQKMIQVQSSLTGGYVPVIVMPGRQFIKEGKMMKICRKKPKERMIYLFTDILLYARTNIFDVKLESFVCRGILPLLNAHIKVELNDTRVPTRNTPVLKLTTEDNNTLLLYSEDEQTTFEWAEAIQSTILELNNGTLKEPIHLAPAPPPKTTSKDIAAFPPPDQNRTPVVQQMEELAVPPELQDTEQQLNSSVEPGGERMQLEELAFPPQLDPPQLDPPNEMNVEINEEKNEDEVEKTHELDSLIASTVQSGTVQSRCCIIS
ncbi:PREDICTED: rho guanine nucleotide exchange factor 39-like isoform X2 [Amphimedon queenslandica]|uniref:DH domain-containing protein n=1 Tax=Amphimedon queenslandica TaxID=400682 RepID=A0A1X7U6L6_AMPQE|nr:PREDICTED: rho guanine nucleotide exchange factor 39-like isoform X2 [Amphimedon queenslandica]|eukprot:XP_019855957.1 PREDICTED: rho guanine nucleotide exchange factor 39-like isoform X2 [Amphimedon queenslandica]